MKNLQFLITFLIGILWIGSCTKNDNFDPDFQLGEAFEIKVAQAVFNPNEDLGFRIKSVLEDSRCPEDAVCVWEGRVKLDVEIEVNNQTFTKELIFLDPVPLECNGYTFQVLEVLPGNQFDETIEQEDYIFTLRIGKA